MTAAATTSSIVRNRVASLVAAGRPLDEIEAKVLDPAPVTEEARSALWLYAWVLHDRRHCAAPTRPTAARAVDRPVRPARFTVIRGHSELERVAR
jgi:phytoene/squalene synthetase